MEKAEEKSITPGLKEFIEAGYPCLYLPTVEPEVATNRIIKALSEVEAVRGVAIANVQFGVWKPTTGLAMARLGDVLGREKDPVRLIKQQKGEAFIDALAIVGEMALQRDPKPVMFVFHNIRRAIEPTQIGNIQQMIDTILTARTVGSCIFIVGAYLDIPPELRTLIQLVECPLPSKDQIKEMFKKMVSAYGDEMDLPEDEEELDTLIDHAANAAVGLDSMGAENSMALSMATSGTIDLRIIQSQKEQEVKKSDVLEFIKVDESIDNVGGFAEFKVWLEKRKGVFSDAAKEYGLPFPKGVLIVGIPGSGKSLCAKAIAHYLGLPGISLDVGKIARSLYGESEQAMRLALQVVEAVAPVVLQIDEIDKGFSGLTGGTYDGGVTQRVLGTFLTWRQDTTAPVFIVATANETKNLPAMVYRKGRFDEVWATDVPDETERKEIFQIHFRKLRTKENGLGDIKRFDFDELVEKTKEFVGAEIEECIKDAMFSAFQKGKSVDESFLLRAIHDTIPQAIRDREEVNEIRKWVATRARLVSGKEIVEKEGIGFIVSDRKVKVKRRSE